MRRRILAAIVILISNAPAYANVGMDYGFGSREAALAGSGVAGGFDGFAAYQNPAGLPLIGSHGDRLAFSYGLIYMQPSFDDINGIVTNNNAVGGLPVGSAQEIGNVTNDYRATIGQVFGLSYQVFPDTAGITLGIVAYLPLNQFDYLDTGESFVPEYVLFRTRTEQPQVNIATGANITDWLHLGVGLRLSFSLTSNMDAYINSAGNGPSTMRLSASVKPVAIPYFGVLFTPKADYTLGAVVRLPAALNYTLQANTDAALIGFLGSAIPLSFAAASTLTYDPLTIELGGTLSGPWSTKLYLQLDFQQWNQFQAPVLEIINPQINCGATPCATSISPGPVLNFNARNIWVPHVGVEKETESHVYRVGYQFHPSIFSQPPDDSGNYLDPDRHILTAGVGFKFKRFLSHEEAWNLDLHADYEVLVSQIIVKTPGNENGNAADPKIGSPGYEAGGKIYGGGASLSFVF